MKISQPGLSPVLSLLTDNPNYRQTSVFIYAMSMDTSLKAYSEMSVQSLLPFLGFEGIGARFSIQKEHGNIIIKETILSQLFLIFLLYLFGPGLDVLFYFKREELLTKPKAILVLVALFSLIGWIFGTKYLLRLLSNRRIVADLKGEITLYESSTGIAKRIRESEIKKISILETQIRIRNTNASPRYRLCYTLCIQGADEALIALCKTDSKKNIEEVKAAIETIITKIN